MGIYNITTEGITRVKKTSFQVNGILERNHLQNHLRDKIEIISKDTLIIAEEFSEWDESKRRIDLLGIDKDANLVVIELKRNDTGDHMELQSLRYASMISTMSFERCVSIFQTYLENRGIPKNAKDELMTFLDWETPLEGEFASNVKIVLASADFSKELTTSVMWLISKGIDITCVKLSPYSFKNELLLDVNQIIPLPEAESYLIKIKEKTIERQIAIQSSKDKTKYYFNNLLLGKGRLVFEIVKFYLKLNPTATFQELSNKFPAKLQGSTGVINTINYITSKYVNSSKKRHFVEKSDVLTSSDNIDFAVSTEWGIGNIHHILELAKNENFTIETR
ncbi:hypothetical protein H9X96_18370 [Pedobacter sp. N36a]|uniref:hypothetical protein n=1 Tax=Pedobacter sp. N36a TaxID=2767996 RepID=UPI001656A158|nr:hypothetical protein [Pedobacter sp. N36a]MBC8987733.1 hypothetical protein [Pedobacter sp. N36a]